MTPTDFSVLLLAWDDADPRVAVLGGAALPPTLPLAYHLAAAQPVLAVFPHLPAEPGAADEQVRAAPAPETGTTGFAAEAAAETTPVGSAAASDAANGTTATAETEATDDTTAAAPEQFQKTAASIRRLVATAPGQPGTAVTSFLVGLEDLATANTSAEIAAALPAPITTTTPVPAPVRSQWPTGANAPQHLGWAAPAAPYMGASAPAGPAQVLAPVPPLVPAPTVREAADLAQAALSWPVGFSPLASSVAAQVLAASAASDAEAAVPLEGTQATADALATGEAEDAEAEHRESYTNLAPAAFEEITEEIGAAEANDLAAPEDNLTPDPPEATAGVAEPAPAQAEAAAAPIPAPTLTARIPSLEGLNSRMIQYARQAAQLVRDRSDFGVIYAPSWPAWLAALEIRNSSRRPLVLYAARLAAEFTGPAERGWLLEVERMTLRRARLILVPTEAVRRQLRAAYGADTGEVRVVAADDEAALRAVLRELAAG